MARVQLDRLRWVQKHYKEAIVSNKPVDWTIWYTDDSLFSSSEGDWANQADLIREGGVGVWLTRKPVRVVTFQHNGLAGALNVPALPAFNFLRFRSSPTLPNPEWLYAKFGYMTPEYRVTVHLSPFAIATHVCKREEPISL